MYGRILGVEGEQAAPQLPGLALRGLLESAGAARGGLGR